MAKCRRRGQCKKSCGGRAFGQVVLVLEAKGRPLPMPGDAQWAARRARKWPLQGLPLSTTSLGRRQSPSSPPPPRAHVPINRARNSPLFDIPQEEE